MRFIITESAYNRGTEKAIVDYDHNQHRYFVPRSMVTIVQRVEPEDAYGTVELVVDIPDWLLKKNQIPVFKMTELTLYR